MSFPPQNTKYLWTGISTHSLVQRQKNLFKSQEGSICSLPILFTFFWRNVSEKVLYLWTEFITHRTLYAGISQNQGHNQIETRWTEQPLVPAITIKRSLFPNFFDILGSKQFSWALPKAYEIWNVSFSAHEAIMSRYHLL